MIGINESIVKRNAIIYWNQDRRNRPVKITSVLREPMFWSEGYVTCHKFIAGRTLPEVERILGLPTHELSKGAYLYDLLRIPEPDEFDLRGYSQCPDGKPWTPASEYPVGAGAAQWQIRRNTFIPAKIAAIIKPGETVP